MVPRPPRSRFAGLLQRQTLGECPAVAQKNRAKDFLILVLYNNGLVWSGAAAGPVWRATGLRAARSPVQTARHARLSTEHRSAADDDLRRGCLTLMGKLICSEMAGQRRRWKRADPDDRFTCFSGRRDPRSRAASCHLVLSAHSRSSCCAPRRRCYQCRQTDREYVPRQGRPACRGLPSVVPV